MIPAYYAQQCIVVIVQSFAKRLAFYVDWNTQLKCAHFALIRHGMSA